MHGIALTRDLVSCLTDNLTMNEIANIIYSRYANMPEGCGLIQERSYLVLFTALPFHLTSFFLKPSCVSSHQPKSDFVSRLSSG
jgi:hypothetical protein